MIKFILNNNLVETDLPPGTTVLDYIRYHKYLMGTKIGCREGDCGACTVLVGDIENNKLVYRSMTSCLMPLGNARGKHIVTVEGINGDGLTPVQQAMVDTNGTQCGFCTLGFVLSFTGFAMAENYGKYEDAIAAIDGNICRCTGYKSIERAAAIITEKVKNKPEKDLLRWSVDKGFVPHYFLKIEERLQELQPSKTTEQQYNGKGDHLILCGGTDLVVQKPLTVKKTALSFLSNSNELKGIHFEEGQFVIGASTTVTEFAESKLISKLFPELKKYIKLISSTPIRNMATLAGNFVNASPIGDFTIFFLALNASLMLNKVGVQRTVLLNQFYKGYKQTDKEEGEFIEKIMFTPPVDSNSFNFEKVSKRMHLDIASVNTACQLTMAKDETISSIHLSAGGVAPYPKYLTNTVAFLKNKKITAYLLQEALQVMDAEIAPISDARGSAAYKRLLLRQLVIAHFLKFFGPVEPIKKVLLHAD